MTVRLYRRFWILKTSKPRYEGLIKGLYQGTNYSHHKNLSLLSVDNLNVGVFAYISRHQTRAQITYHSLPSDPGSPSH